MWREAPLSAFTPLFLASLDLDLALFGLQPRAFLVHQLLAIALCSAALYALLRAWLPLPAACLGGALFALGPAVAASAPLLMVRHYFESLGLAALAAGAYVVALRGGRWRWAHASAALYLLAMLEKEIAVPLVLLLPLAPEGDLRRRLRYLAPHAAALAVYLLHRAWLREPWTAGYGWTVAPEDRVALVLALPRKLAKALAGEGPAAWVLLAALLGAGLALAGRGRLRLLAALAAAVLPIVPVSTEMEPRFALAAWSVLAAAVAFAAARVAGRGPRGRALAAGLAAFALGGAAIAGRSVWRERLAEAERRSIENRFLARAGERDVLSHPASAASTLETLQQLLGSGTAASAAWFRDDLALCVGRAAGRRLWQFDAAARAVREVSADARAARERACGEVRWEAPLAARFTWRGDGLHWQLDPYAAPGYAIVFGDGTERITVPRRGGYRLNAPTVSLRVRYEDPSGWITYSPELHLERAQPERSWTRP